VSLAGFVLLVAQFAAGLTGALLAETPWRLFFQQAFFFVQLPMAMFFTPLRPLIPQNPNAVWR